MLSVSKELESIPTDNFAKSQNIMASSETAGVITKRSSRHPMQLKERNKDTKLRSNLSHTKDIRLEISRSLQIVEHAFMKNGLDGVLKSMVSKTSRRSSSICALTSALIKKETSSQKVPLLCVKVCE